MFSSTFYYLLKPFIPRWLQIQLRRSVTLAARPLYRTTWPIDERAGDPPEGWRGWPNGRRFAFVVTHDVETARGQERCPGLAKLDKELGVQSSFNFVPERYRVSDALRHELTKHGFEVGVHGLNHDGNLYSSRKRFAGRAGRINSYLKEWQSAGFRTACMYHNLDWIGDLNIEYDCSTFDTDPFEPQPDGAKTIFPFWVGKGGCEGGYVELPYTLPQDFTLFILMKEKSIDIWKKKLDWIAEKGGMALLIAHPDYMNDNKGGCNVEEYPIEFYEEFLHYVRNKHEGQYWNPLPKELARFWKGMIGEERDAF